jgi:hypothetical protein
MTIRLDSDSRVPVRGICRRDSQSGGHAAAGGGNRQTPSKREPSQRSSRQSATATMTIRALAPRRRCEYRRN